MLAKPAVGAAYDPLLTQRLELELKEKLLAEFDPARKAVAADEAGDLLSNKTLFRVINNIQVRCFVLCCLMLLKRQAYLCPP